MCRAAKAPSRENSVTARSALCFQRDGVELRKGQGSGFPVGCCREYPNGYRGESFDSPRSLPTLQRELLQLVFDLIPLNRNGPWNEFRHSPGSGERLKGVSSYRNGPRREPFFLSSRSEERQIPGVSLRRATQRGG